MSRRARPPGARAGATTLATAAVTVGILQALQQVVGAFNPRPAVTALFTASVALATLALERQRVRRGEHQTQAAREAQLDELLRCWPLPLVRDADPYRLGVFPPRRTDRPPLAAPYIRRAPDDRLEEALRESPFVLVFGPPRAGKSRTALECAARALPDARVIAPRDGDSLRELLELDPPLEPDASHAVLWLDGLERFVEVLGDGKLEALAAAAVPVTIIATIRTDDYDALLSASGEIAEAAKEVAGRARAFELPAQLTRGELEQAGRAYEGEELREGLGLRLSATGKEERPPVIRAQRSPPVSTTGSDRPSFLRDGLVAVPAAGSVGALLAVAVVALTVGVSKPPPPPSIGAQVEQVKRAATAGDRLVAFSRAVDFHGSGDPSHLFVFQAKNFYDRYFPGVWARYSWPREPPPSDEIRIYDRRGGKLVENFRFQPKNDTAVFNHVFLGDIDDNGEEELVGGYGIPREASEALLPFIIYWDNSRSRYKIDSLLTKAPTLRQGVRPRPEARTFLDAYRTPLTLQDGKTGVRGYRAQDFAVTKRPARLASALAFDPKTKSQVGEVELRVSIFRLSGEQPDLLPCRFEDDRPLRLRWSTGLDLGKAIARRARAIKRSCARL